MYNKSLSNAVLIVLISISGHVSAASIAYIHGRVADNGMVLNQGQGTPYDQMLITDSGNTGLSAFRSLVQGQGHTIAQFRDNQTMLSTAFLNNYDVVIFGLHQKLWSVTEKSALAEWLNRGGGMFIYSDSASGGWFSVVGAQNPVGQTVTNNLIAQYGMQVTVDQADGTNSQTASAAASIVGIRGLELEGEGVSPIAVAQGDSNVEILIPYVRSRNPLIPHPQNISINNPVYASMVRRRVGQGDIVVMFDRQPMWNAGPGSDITKKDNMLILREMINVLAINPVATPPTSTPRANPSGAKVISPINLLLDD